MKTIHFYILFAAIAAIQAVLILSGFLTPLFSYSLGNILFSLIVAAIIIYMGWSFAKLSLKKVAMRGVIAALIAVAVISLFTIVGYIIKKPVLGVQLPSIYYLPLPLLSLALQNVVLFVVLAVFGAWLARKIKPPKKLRRKR